MSLQVVSQSAGMEKISSLVNCAIGSAYLGAVAMKRLYIVAGPEFEELEGHILIIYKALYGLKSSGLRWTQESLT